MIFKCKMCGGSLDINNNETVAICEYCDTRQTLPKLDDDKRANMYDRANHFRRNNEFDKAMGIYEQILNEDNTDSEAYWSLVLCSYGIEYVEDTSSHKRIPTVNRVQFTSIFDDDNFKSALKYADAYQRQIYEEEAKAINEIQKGILAISQKEEPFDIFICYKESDKNGRRTPDSVLAQELYYLLTKEGFKVFFSRITLEDKLGTAYEPYIFAALNSAKVMVVLGTRPEFFNAVWVKNEWSRYLSLIKQGKKKILIPAYKDMNPYDMPEEFFHLQAQDMSKLGFMQDLLSGIRKIIKMDGPKSTVIKEGVEVIRKENISPLLKRAFIFIEDEEWDTANRYCEKILDTEPENALAYVGKLMVELHVTKRENLRYCSNNLENNGNYKRALRFATGDLRAELIGCVEYIKEQMILKKYNTAKEKMLKATSSAEYLEVKSMFETIIEFKDSVVLAKRCEEAAGEFRKKMIYSSAIKEMQKDKLASYIKAINILKPISEYEDVNKKIAFCKQKIIQKEREIAAKTRLKNFCKSIPLLIIAIIPIVAFIAILCVVLSMI